MLMRAVVALHGDLFLRRGDAVTAFREGELSLESTMVMVVGSSLTSRRGSVVLTNYHEGGITRETVVNLVYYVYGLAEVTKHTDRIRILPSELANLTAEGRSFAPKSFWQLSWHCLAGPGISWHPGMIWGPAQLGGVEIIRNHRLDVVELTRRTTEVRKSICTCLNQLRRPTAHYELGTAQKYLDNRVEHTSDGFVPGSYELNSWVDHSPKASFDDNTVFHWLCDSIFMRLYRVFKTLGIRTGDDLLHLSLDIHHHTHRQNVREAVILSGVAWKNFRRALRDFVRPVVHEVAVLSPEGNADQISQAGLPERLTKEDCRFLLPRLNDCGILTMDDLQHMAGLVVMWEYDGILRMGLGLLMFGTNWPALKSFFGTLRAE
ncbi:hypothetical protein BDZ89DRAFT_1051108 [Hymenopellis radicata]|nr:hypothetical protein BDZ89DRAFT_1051108 [Hymenopellis radicata]